MIMPNDCQFQCAHHCSLPDISYKMKFALWLCIYNSGCNPSNFVVDNEHFFFPVPCSPFKYERKNNQSPFAQTFVDK